MLTRGRPMPRTKIGRGVPPPNTAAHRPPFPPVTALHSIIFPITRVLLASSSPPRPSCAHPSIDVPDEPLQRQIQWSACLLPLAHRGSGGGVPGSCRDRSDAVAAAEGSRAARPAAPHGQAPGRRGGRLVRRRC
jgi:hypothetical protein